MKDVTNSWKNRDDNEILFSRVVKAGKRVYYIDVKCDRYDEYYLALTESKRVKDGTETERPVFEKHKIFLYREDILKFLGALTDAAQFVGEHRSLLSYHDGQEIDPLPKEMTDGADFSEKFDIEF
ncbi:MAG: DUF3276 family protein [Bacteroidaceae bacterium]|nr:DUF3276 family protein [Bacteroidaceae bacterium]